MRKPRLIYNNDGRHYLMYRYDPPLTLWHLRQPVDEILGTGVDTLSFGLVSRQPFPHETTVGLQWTWTDEHAAQVMFWRAGENLKQAYQAGLDPLKIVVDRAHEKGLLAYTQLLWDLRGMYADDALQVASPADYARPEVRNERLDMTEEALGRYGLDGIEMTEFTRVLKPSDDRQHDSAVTDFIREVRELVRRVGSKRGEDICLAVVVHPLEETNTAVGMDVRTWLSEKLVDMVIPLQGLPIFDSNPSVAWLIDAAREAGVWVYAPVGGMPYDDRHHEATVEMYRAAASNLVAAGADGLYLSSLPWPHTAEDYQVLRELGDPDVYGRKARHYLLSPRDPIGPFAQGQAPQLRNKDNILETSFDLSPAPFSIERHLPQVLAEGETVRVPVLVGDDLDEARAAGVLKQVTLGVRVVMRCHGDELVFRFNGRELAAEDAEVEWIYSGSVSYTAHRWGLPMRIWSHDWLHFELPLELARRGENVVEVTLGHRFEGMTADRVLHQAELLVAYREPPVPRQGQM